MKNLLVFAFIVCIPALLFLAHDLYIFYDAQGKPTDPSVVTKLATETRPAKAFDFSSMGFMLNKYSPGTNMAMRDSLSEEDLQKYELFLTFKGFYLSVAFALIMIVLGSFVVIARAAQEKASNMHQISKRRRQHRQH